MGVRRYIAVCFKRAKCRCFTFQRAGSIQRIHFPPPPAHFGEGSTSCDVSHCVGVFACIYGVSTSLLNSKQRLQACRHNRSIQRWGLPSREDTRRNGCVAVCRSSVVKQWSIRRALVGIVGHWWVGQLNIIRTHLDGERVHFTFQLFLQHATQSIKIITTTYIHISTARYRRQVYQLSLESPLCVIFKPLSVTGPLALDCTTQHSKLHSLLQHSPSHRELYDRVTHGTYLQG